MRHNVDPRGVPVTLRNNPLARRPFTEIEMANERADLYRAVARNLAQVLLDAADTAERGGFLEEARDYRTAYARQCKAHGVSQ